MPKFIIRNKENTETILTEHCGLDIGLMFLKSNARIIFCCSWGCKATKLKVESTKKRVAEQAEWLNFFSDLQLLHVVVLQSLELQGCILSHLKALIPQQSI